MKSKIEHEVRSTDGKITNDMYKIMIIRARGELPEIMHLSPSEFTQFRKELAEYVPK